MMIAGFFTRIFGIQDIFRLAGFALQDYFHSLLSHIGKLEDFGLGNILLSGQHEWRMWEELLLELRSRNNIANYIALIAGAYKTYALFGARLRFLRELHVVNTAI